MALTGDTQHQGMADAGRDTVGPMVLGAWDTFLEQAAAVDLLRPTRLPGWRAQEVCVHLGLWDDHAALPDLIASARAGCRCSASSSGRPTSSRCTAWTWRAAARPLPHHRSCRPGWPRWPT